MCSPWGLNLRYCWPSGKRLHNYGNHHSNGTTHYEFYKWPFSIAILTEPEGTMFYGGNPLVQSKIWRFLMVESRFFHHFLVGALEHDWIMTFHSVGNGKSSQLLLTPSFFKGVGIPPRSFYCWYHPPCFSMAKYGKNHWVHHRTGVMSSDYIRLSTKNQRSTTILQTMNHYQRWIIRLYQTRSDYSISICHFYSCY